MLDSNIFNKDVLKLVLCFGERLFYAQSIEISFHKTVGEGRKLLLNLDVK